MASLFISALMAPEMLSAMILDSSTPKFSTRAASRAWRSSTLKVLVLMMTSVVPATFWVWVSALFVTPSTTGTTSLEIRSKDISSLKVTLVDVPPLKSRP